VVSLNILGNNKLFNDAGLNFDSDLAFGTRRCTSSRADNSVLLGPDLNSPDLNLVYRLLENMGRRPAESLSVAGA